MTNPQGPGKRKDKDNKGKAAQPHHQASPGRSEQPAQSARPHEQRPGPSSSHSSHHSSHMDEDEE